MGREAWVATTTATATAINVWANFETCKLSIWHLVSEIFKREVEIFDRLLAQELTKGPKEHYRTGQVDEDILQNACYGYASALKHRTCVALIVEKLLDKYSKAYSID